MGIQSIVENELFEDDGSVWCLNNHSKFGYTDGARSDRYLKTVFDSATDLSTSSRELESFIKDWPSEYHLSTKRAQLLSGFSFDPSLKALEVGCGCGAITRHLGENFNQVVSVEGDISRAHLARQRTRDLNSVSIICSPFQDLKFKKKFDIIFCIGVFEYSGSFIKADDPYDAALQYFSEILNPGGMVVMAIENQFGLKYFGSSREDHLGIMFEGVEGYHKWPGKVRTFGKTELEARLKKYFPKIQSYYPYPDYKLPECVISSEFMTSGKAGELVSRMRSRDYAGPTHFLFDEATTCLELDRNNMLEFFANSFLLVAGGEDMTSDIFKQHAVLNSSGRKAEYSTQTRVLKGENGQTRVEKRKAHSDIAAPDSPVKLLETNSLWQDGLSLQMQVALRARAYQRPLEEVFKPCKKWVDLLMAESNLEDGVRYLPGSHIDSIWSNAFIDGNECKIIDKEWIWQDKIPMNVVVIRAIYDFLSEIEAGDIKTKSLSARSGSVIIKNIASTLGVDLEAQDFTEFTRIESALQHSISDRQESRTAAYISWFLSDRPTRRFMRRMKRQLTEHATRMRERVLSRI